MNKRILPLDGLRTIAVLGVMWKHIWSVYDNIPLKAGPIDINKMLSIFGNGVDLFFVISGFCMYIMYGAKTQQFTMQGYFEFLKKRVKRIVPAFYVLLSVELVIFFIKYNEFPYTVFFAHVFFLNIFLSFNSFAPHYWSLATEWHFYLLLPFLFAGSLASRPLIRRVLIMTGICVLLRIILFYLHQPDLVNKVTVNSDAVWFRFAEFGFGIIAAICYKESYILPRLLSGAGGFIIAFAIAYAGRICMLSEFVNAFGSGGFIIRALGEPLMTLGFALMVYNVVTTKSFFQTLLSGRWIVFIGKISYSMYLWHWLVFSVVSAGVLAITGKSNVGFYLSFVLSVLVAIPISWASYRLLEIPYFRKEIKAPLIPETPTAKPL